MQGQLFSTAISRMTCPMFGWGDLTAPLSDAVTGNGFHARRSLDLVPALTREALWIAVRLALFDPYPRDGGGVTRRGYRTGGRGVGAPFTRDPANL